MDIVGFSISYFPVVSVLDVVLEMLGGSTGDSFGPCLVRLAWQFLLSSVNFIALRVEG